MTHSILLDMSAWICYLRPRGWDDLKTAVQQVLTAEQVHTCWGVITEIPIGARDEQGLTQVFENLRALPEIPGTDRVWEAAARLGYTLRRQGVTNPLPDLVIAQAAITGDLVLWHVDDHFEHLRRHSTLQTRSFVPETRE